MRLTRKTFEERMRAAGLMSPMQRLALQARAFGFALECAQQRARSARECVDPRQRAEMRAQMRWWAVSARVSARDWWRALLEAVHDEARK